LLTTVLVSVKFLATGRRGPDEMAGTRRLSRQQRREQIIDVTLASVAQNGVKGTTLSRIAAGVGVTTPALYAHFENRREILLAALDVLFEHRTLPHRFPAEGNALERLRGIGHRHTQLVSSEDDRSVVALFEFIAAPPEEGLREALGEKHLTLVHDIANMVRDGQEEGSIREDADPDQTAWMIVGRAWTEDVAHLMGISAEWDEERSNRMLDLILDSVAAKPQNS
jgi:AcrR family transcriptional regulator